jgi:hypothetical protein
VRLRGTPPDIAGEVTALLVMTAGILITARHAPQTASPVTAGYPAGTGHETTGQA